MTTVNTMSYSKVKSKRMKVTLVEDEKVSVVEVQQEKSLYLSF
jgi:hypothetical protein